MLRRVLLSLVMAVGVTIAVVSVDLLGAEELTDERVLAVLHAGAADPGDTAVRDVALIHCPDCRVVESGAGDDATQQRTEVAALVDEDADVVVVEPVAGAPADLVAEARAVPVVAVGTPLPGAERFVGYEPGGLARVLARAIADEAGDGARVLVVGPATDEDRAELGEALGEVVAVEPGGVAGRRLATFDAVVVLDPGLVPDVADVLARVPAGDRPGLAGADGGLDAARRLVLGRQTWLAPVDSRQVWELAATAGAELVIGSDRVPEGLVDGVPADLLEPRLVMLETLTDTLVRDGQVSLDDLCAGATAKRCTALGLT